MTRKQLIALSLCIVCGAEKAWAQGSQTRKSSTKRGVGTSGAGSKSNSGSLLGIGASRRRAPTELPPQRTPDLSAKLLGGVSQGGHKDGTVASALFRDPSGMCMGDDGALYVCDTGNHCIRRVDIDRNVVTISGAVGERGNLDAIGRAAKWNAPVDICEISPHNYLVADRDGHCIRQLWFEGDKLSNPNAWHVRTVAGGSAAGNLDGKGEDARFASPMAVCKVGPASYAIADKDNNAIRLLRHGGSYETPKDWSVSTRNTRIEQPCGLSPYPAGGLLVNCFHQRDDANNVWPYYSKIVLLYANNTVKTIATSGSRAALVSGPIVADRDGNVYAPCTERRYNIMQNGWLSFQLTRVDPQGLLHRVVRTTGVGYPTGLTIDSMNNLVFSVSNQLYELYTGIDD